MVIEWIAIGISLVAIGLSIYTLKRPRQQSKYENSSMADLMTLLVDKEIKKHKQNVAFWYWNRRDRSEPVYFKNTKYENSANQLEQSFNKASEIYENNLIEQEKFREIFGGTLVRFWRILEDEILHEQETKADFCKNFQKVAKKLMEKYGIVGEPYRTSPQLPEN